MTLNLTTPAFCNGLANSLQREQGAFPLHTHSNHSFRFVSFSGEAGLACFTGAKGDGGGEW